jgi:outer membrane lipopolysaccharide assembly protein LptE/RlpB
MVRRRSTLPLTCVSALLICVTAILSSCGYQFQGTGSVLPPTIKTVYVPLVDNQTSESRVTNLLTEALQDRFERFGVVAVTSDPINADATLKVRVTKVRRTTASSTSVTDEAVQQDMAITIAGELRSAQGKVLWSNNALTANQTSANAAGAVVSSSSGFASGDFSASSLGSLNQRELARGQEAESLNVICESLAQKVYDEAVAPEF